MTAADFVCADCAAVLFDIAFPAVFQSFLDMLSVLSLDLYTFIGELSVPHCAQHDQRCLSDRTMQT